MHDVSCRDWPHALGVSHCSPSRAEQNRSEPNRISWVVRSCTDAPFIPLQLSWQPNPFCPLRVAVGASRRVAVFVRTERRFRWITLVRVAFSVRYALNAWRVVQGLARRLRRHSHCKPSRSEQNRNDPIRLGKQTYFMKRKRSHCTSIRAAPNGTEPDGACSVADVF